MITLIIWIFANNHQQKEPSLQYKVEKKNITQYESFSGSIIYSNELSIVCKKDYPIKEVFVKLGDNVSVGDKLFTYDPEPCLEQIEEYEKLLAELLSQDNKVSRETDTDNFQITLDYLQGEYSETNQAIIDLEGNLKLYKDELLEANEYKEHISVELSTLQVDSEQYSKENVDDDNLEENVNDDNLEENVNDDNLEENVNDDNLEENSLYITEETNIRKKKLIADYENISNKIKTLSENIDSIEQLLAINKDKLEQLNFEIQKTQLELNYANDLENEASDLLLESMTQFYQEKINKCKNELENLTCYSSMNGIISQINEKSKISFNSTIMKIAEPEKFSASFSANADKCFYISKGMKAEVSVSTFPKNIFLGNVCSVLQQDDTNYQIIISLNNDCSNFILPYANAYAKVIYEEYNDTLAVPYDYIYHDESGKSYVLAIEGEDKVKKYVDILFDSDYYTAISSQTLHDQDTIIKSEVE